MSSDLRVLGIDLASRSWQDNGSAILGFNVEQWKSVEYGCIKWPNRQLSAAAMAEVIEDVIRERTIAAVSLDGPRGWREPAGGEPGIVDFSHVPLGRFPAKRLAAALGPSRATSFSRHATPD